MTDHAFFMAKAYDEAFTSYQSGGGTVGSVLVRDNQIIAQGHNQRVQQSDSDRARRNGLPAQGGTAA